MLASLILAVNWPPCPLVRLLLAALSLRQSECLPSHYFQIKRNNWKHQNNESKLIEQENDETTPTNNNDMKMKVLQNSIYFMLHITGQFR